MNMPTEIGRRKFIQGAGALGAVAVGGAPAIAAAASQREYNISVAGWSFHKMVFAKEINQLGLFKLIREDYDLDAFELVNNMLEVPTWDYVQRLGREAKKYNVEIPLIMIDSEGSLGGLVDSQREKAVQYHAKWVTIAADLGCHSIRVNWGGAPAGVEKDEKKADELIERSAQTYRSLCEIGKRENINIIIENHWGPSSFPDLLVKLMKAVDMPNFGTLPDFGNFPDQVDKYEAIDKMMPYAKAVSAKCYDFDDESGEETKIDFARMIEIVVDKHGYNGYIGIEYEGPRLSEKDGVRAARDLLVKLRG